MSRAARDAAVVAAIATALIAVIAARVIAAPSDRVFGQPIAGYHHDPFTFMQQIDGPLEASVYLQPITDGAGAAVARLTGPVAASNWIVLLTFPLSAIAAYLLARHLAIARAWAAAAALAFAFSPFHLAHAAYHPHVAQTQWMPLYLLALLRWLDRPAWQTGAAFAASAGAVMLSNDYGGLIAAMITPAVVGAHWIVTGRFGPAPFRRLALGVAAPALIACAAVAAAWYAAPALFLNAGAFAAAPDDLLRYGARWWSYLMPPVAHPMVGAMAARAWLGHGVDAGMLEQQITLGVGVILLGVAGVSATGSRARTPAWRAGVPIIAAAAVAAFTWSLTGGPGGVLYGALPMFRSYARFGVVVQLMAVLLAAMGAQWLWGRGSRVARAACVLLVALAAAEYAVWPPAMSRPVLPTAAHRWVARHPGAIRALDCAPPAADVASIQWATAGRVSHEADAIDRCGEPDVAARLAGAGYTHLILRRDADGGRRSRALAAPAAGLQLAAHFADSDVYAVAALTPRVETVLMTSFLPRERDAAWSWRWIGAAASWTIANRGGEPIEASLDVELMAFSGVRPLTVLLDGRVRQTLMIADRRETYRIGPLPLTPGEHQLTFRPDDPPSRGAPGSGETRALSFRVGGWQWIVHEGTR